MIQTITQTDRLQTFYTGVSRRATPDHPWKHDVLQGRQFRKEKVALENKTHLLVAQLSEGRFAASIKFLSFEFHFARFRPLASGESVEQGCLPRSRGATEENRLT